MKSVDEVLQSQLANPKNTLVKLRGTIKEPLIVKRSVTFTGSAVIEAPIIIESGLKVDFNHVVLTVNGWNGQLGITDSFTGRLILNDTTIQMGTNLVKVYDQRVNTGEPVQPLVISNASNANIRIESSQLETASIMAETLLIKDSEIGFLFGPLSGFDGYKLQVQNSLLSNFQASGEVMYKTVSTMGGLRFTNLTKPAYIGVLDVLPVQRLTKKGDMIALQEKALALSKITADMGVDDLLPIDVLTVNGDLVVDHVIYDKGLFDLTKRFTYGLSLLNMGLGHVTIKKITGLNGLEFSSLVGGDLKVTADQAEVFETAGSGHVSTVGRRREASGDGAVPESEAVRKLNQMIGLDNVKKQVRKIIASTAMRQQRGEKMPSLHMVFSGNAGTGKTSVAELVAQALFENGVIRTSTVVTATKEDLVAGYVGQTATKTRQVVEKAYGGVLFIDEAYTLTADNAATGFEAEAIGELIAQMENHRDDLIVIMAGYTEDMRRLMRSNQGLNSRFKLWLEFEDYTPKELTRIAIAQIQSAGQSLSKQYAGWLYQAMQLFAKNGLTSSNGRFVRNFTETLLDDKDERVYETNAPDVLMKQDIVQTIREMKERSKF